jgi:hypothetical protein
MSKRKLIVAIGDLRIRLVFPILISYSPSAVAQLIKSVDGVGMRVADMDRSVEFLSRVLPFEKVSDVEVAGTEHEALQGASARICQSGRCGSVMSLLSCRSTWRAREEHRQIEYPYEAGETGLAVPRIIPHLPACSPPCSLQVPPV